MNFGLHHVLRTSDRSQNHPFVFWVLTILVILGAFTADGPWQGRIGGLALVMGVLVTISPGVVLLPKTPTILGFLFLIFGWGAFLPAEWFGIPSWRSGLTELGVQTGEFVAIQSRSAFESQLYFVLLFLAGLWVTTLRASSRVLKVMPFVLVLGVAGYAVISEILGDEIQTSRGGQHFGFFPNRNHSSTFLSLGFLCGLGLIFQAIRNKNFIRLGIVLVAVSVILWAVFSWSISRAGIVLCLTGAVIWFVCLGLRYFGRQELKSLGLATILVVGVFAVSELTVKERFASTVERVAGSPDEEADSLDEVGEVRKINMVEVDFRVPVALDSMKMIADAPLTGVGAGQFEWVFPQYRNHTIVMEQAVALHPESSWLWLAAELGLPASLLLLFLVAWFFYRGFRRIRQSGVRDKALRMGCLVAAFLVPLHAVFDVPAHRPVFIFASLLLYALSQPPHNQVSGQERTLVLWRIGSLLIGLILVVAGGLILSGAGLGWRAPMVVKAERDLVMGADLYREVAKPKPGLEIFDLLKMRREISSLADEAIQDSPLDGRLYRLRALSALPMRSNLSEVSRDFAIDRQLEPNAVRVPMIHASASLFYAEKEVAKAWSEAILRSERVDEKKGNKRLREMTVQKIQSQVSRSPQLRGLFEKTTQKR